MLSIGRGISLNERGEIDLSSPKKDETEEFYVSVNIFGGGAPAEYTIPRGGRNPH